MAVTVAIKRCKGCIFWQLYRSEITNAAMQKLLNVQAPKSKQHACTLRLREVKGADGEIVKRPSFFPGDAPGPRYGKRVGPNAVCDHHTPKRPPYRRPLPVVVPLEEHTLVDGPNPFLHGHFPEGELRTVEFTG